MKPIDQEPVSTFSELNLHPAIYQAIEDQGYDTPSAIQAQAIPVIMQGRDVMGAAQTGTGKTAGFTLPLLHRLMQGKRVGGNRIRALIITPTRELAAQVADSIKTYGKHVPLRSAVVFGGVKINPQMMALRKGVDILVATPGRLLDLHQQNAVKFDQVEVLVLDEADRMLDMGFLPDIKRVLSKLPKDRQNLLFSATFSDEIRDLARGLVKDPVEVSVTPRNSTVRSVDQWVYPVDKKRKSALLTSLIKKEKWGQTLVFCKTKHGANKLVKQLLEKDIEAVAIHGNKSQGARTRALADFKAGTVQILVATDIAARGIDIHQLPQVVNFDLPNVPEDYVHRIGRTGRAGARGVAVSLVCADEADLLSDIERLIQRVLPRETVAGFEPAHDVPSKSLRAPKGKSTAKKKPKSQASSGNPRSGGERRSNGPPRRRKKKVTAKSANTRHGDNRSSNNRSGNSHSENSNSGNTRSNSENPGNRKTDQAKRGQPKSNHSPSNGKRHSGKPNSRPSGNDGAGNKRSSGQGRKPVSGNR